MTPPTADVVAVHGLPETLPIFPLAGVLLLPRAKLPLNIFEPRYLAMTRDAMAGARIIGMVQPLDPETEGGRAPAVYPIGCAGRISSFRETDDGRYLITLAGLCRFGITGELPLTESEYRQARVSYRRFAGDLIDTPAEGVDRGRLIAAVRAYFEAHGYDADWDAIEQAALGDLISTLAMICPFAANEKQALLEAGDVTERARVMIALMEMSALDGAGTENLQ